VREEAVNRLKPNLFGTKLKWGCGRQSWVFAVCWCSLLLLEREIAPLASGGEKTEPIVVVVHNANLFGILLLLQRTTAAEQLADRRRLFALAALPSPSPSSALSFIVILQHTAALSHSSHVSVGASPRRRRSRSERGAACAHVRLD
jgi:hypothetical protein